MRVTFLIAVCAIAIVSALPEDTIQLDAGLVQGVVSQQAR